MLTNAALGLCQVWKVENPPVPQWQTSPPAPKARGASNLLESHYKGEVQPWDPKTPPQEMNLGLDALFTCWFALVFFPAWIEELSNPRGVCRVWIALVWQKPHELNNDLMLNVKPAQRAEFSLHPSWWVRGSKPRRLCASEMQGWAGPAGLCVQLPLWAHPLVDIHRHKGRTEEQLLLPFQGSIPRKTPPKINSKVNHRGKNTLWFCLTLQRSAFCSKCSLMQEWCLKQHY